ncbi:MAG: hypothetical protein HQM14_09005 [SAR324 cluster bacterium]|nr:hypothetical protein [SAR324 cluster bacterium]
MERHSGISLFLSDNISENAYQELYVTLEQDYRLKNINEVPSEQALALLKKQLNENQEVLDHIDKTILPVTIDLEIRSEYYTDAESIVKKIRHQEGITDIIYPQQALETILHLSQGTRQLYTILELLGSLLVMSTLFYFIHTSFQQQTDEIELLYSTGASALSIRLPFLLEVGMVLGVSILISCNILFIGYQINLFFPSFQETNLFFDQPMVFYEWQDLIGLGILILLLGETYAYWMIEHWCTQLTIR